MVETVNNNNEAQVNKDFVDGSQKVSEIRKNEEKRLAKNLEQKMNDEKRYKEEINKTRNRLKKSDVVKNDDIVLPKTNSNTGGGFTVGLKHVKRPSNVDQEIEKRTRHTDLIWG